MTCTIKFWRDMDGGTTCGKRGPKFTVTDGPGGPFLRGDQKFHDRSIGWALFGVNFRPLQEIESNNGGWADI